MWASKFNERAMLSMRKVGLDFRDLRMAVVVQVPAPVPCSWLLGDIKSMRQSQPRSWLHQSCSVLCVAAHAHHLPAAFKRRAASYGAQQTVNT